MDENEKWREALEKMADQLGVSADEVSKLLGSLKGLNQTMAKHAKKEDVEKWFKNFKEGLESGEMGLDEAYGALGRQAKAIKENTGLTDAQKKSYIQNIVAQQRAIQTQQRLNLTGEALGTALLGLGKLYVDLYFMQAEAVLEQISTIQGGASGIKIAVAGMNRQLKIAAEEAAGLANVFGGMMKALAFLPGLGTALRVAALAIGGIAEFFGMVQKRNAELQAKANEVMADGAQQLLDGYKNITKSGANFASGIDELATQSHRAGLTVKQMSEVVQQNQTLLAKSGLGITGGIKKLADVGQAMTKQQQESLRRLGFNTEEIYGISAQVIADAGRLGKQLDAKEVAQLTQKYARDLKIIADITGEDARKKMDEQRKQMENLAFQDEILRTARTLGLNARETTEFTENITASLTKKGPLFATAMNSFFANGAVVGDAAVALSQKSAEYQRMFYDAGELYKRGNIAQADALYEQMAKQDQAITEQQSAMSRAGNLFGEFSGANTLLMQERQFQLSLAGIESKQIEANIGNAEQGAGKLNAQIAAIETAAQGLRVQLEKGIVAQMPKFVDKLNEELRRQIAALQHYTGALSDGGGLNIKDFSISGMLKKIENGFLDLIGFIKKKFEELFPELFASIKSASEQSLKGEGIRRDVSPAYQVRPQVQERSYGSGAGSNISNIRELEIPSFDNFENLDSGVKSTRELPKKASGGVVNEPSIAGEAGPEAVVPLPNGGKIPVKLDLSPMISLLERHTKQNDEILRYLRDSVDVQERIYSAQS
jgi:tetratricopeptide (TPR) repeat protein